MNLYYLTKKYGEGKGESMMWKAIAIASDALDRSMDTGAKDRVLREIYGEMSGCHYNEEFAKEDVAKMYYEDASGNKRKAPYWTDEQVGEVYSAIRDRIPSEYNIWDFYVTLNMIKSDYCVVLKDWFPEAGPDDMEGKLVELAINWLNDDDNPYGNAKIWRYLNPVK